MTNLERLDLLATRVAHLEFAAGLSNLQQLVLRRTSVGGQTITEFRFLQKLEHLEILDLRDVDLTDADLAALTPLMALRELQLSAATVRVRPEREESVPDLELPTMRRPQYLSVSRETTVGHIFSTMGRLSAESVRALQQERGCHIRCFETAR